MPQFFLPGESQSCKHILGVQQGTAEILEGEPYSAKAKAKKRVWLVQGSGTNKYTVTHEPQEEEEPPRAKAQKTEPEVKCEDCGETTAASTAAVVEEKVRIGQRVCIINPTDDDVGMEGTVVHCEAGLYKDGILVRFEERVDPDGPFKRSSIAIIEQGVGAASSSSGLFPLPEVNRSGAKRIRLLKWADGFTVEDVTTAIPMSAQDEACAINLTTHLPLRKYTENEEFMKDVDEGIPPLEFRELITDQATGEMRPRLVDMQIGDMRPMEYPGTSREEERRQILAAQEQGGASSSSSSAAITTTTNAAPPAPAASSSNACGKRKLEPIIEESPPPPPPAAGGDDDSDSDCEPVEDRSHEFERPTNPFDTAFTDSESSADEDDGTFVSPSSMPMLTIEPPQLEKDKPIHEWDLDALPNLSLHELKERARLCGQNVTGRKADLLRIVVECVVRRQRVEADRVAAEMARSQGLLKECPFCLKDVKASEYKEHCGPCRERMLWATGGRVPDHLKF